jgi:hypothetical protein
LPPPRRRAGLHRGVEQVERLRPDCGHSTAVQVKAETGNNLVTAKIGRMACRTPTVSLGIA